MEISNKRFIKRTDYVTRNIAGETIVVPVRGRVGDLDSIYTVNEVGTTIWELIDGEHSVDQIVAAVQETYEVSEEDARKDVTEFIQTLHEESLIQLVEPCKD